MNWARGKQRNNESSWYYVRMCLHNHHFLNLYTCVCLFVLLWERRERRQCSEPSVSLVLVFCYFCIITRQICSRKSQKTHCFVVFSATVNIRYSPPVGSTGGRRTAAVSSNSRSYSHLKGVRTCSLIKLMSLSNLILISRVNATNSKVFTGTRGEGDESGRFTGVI